MLFAFGLSLFLPGAGQWFVGQRKKAGLVLLAAVATLSCCGLINLLSAIDAAGIARKINAGRRIGPYESGQLITLLDALG